ncbi:MAG: hypothetical protein U5K99_02340 [Anaerolineales bacterium]|nr:hypothetical protein [Anaerolineales bacterium]
MGFLDKVKSLFAPQGDRRGRMVYARCEKCGEILHTRVDLYHDLSVEYGDRRGEDKYFSRKVLMGDSGCFQRVELDLIFDRDRRLVDVDARGGEYLTAEEAAAAGEDAPVD